MAHDEETEATALEFTPTWIVAGVCSLIVLLSLLAERGLHYLGKVCMQCMLCFHGGFARRFSSIGFISYILDRSPADGHGAANLGV
jgi:hypothetical protein